MFQYFTNIWNATVAFLASNSPIVILTIVAGTIIGVIVALYIDNLERQNEMREIDSEEWGHLAEALIQSQEKIDLGPLLPINGEYCWMHDDRDGENMGGWTCQHRECVSPGPVEQEQDMQALDMSIIGKDCPDCHMFLEEGHVCPDDNERLESSAQRWQESQAEQDYWQRRAAEGYSDCSPTCNCPECVGVEP